MKMLKSYKFIALFAGSFLIVASSEAQQALTEQYLEAIKEVEQMSSTAATQADQQKSTEELRELGAALQAIPDGADMSVSTTPLFDLPRTVFVISVECNGECSDNNIGELCRLAGTNLVPIAVDCRDVDDDNPGVQCGGGGDNRCLSRRMQTSDSLSFYCDDSSGWDAQVYCASR